MGSLDKSIPNPLQVGVELTHKDIAGCANVGLAVDIDFHFMRLVDRTFINGARKALSEQHVTWSEVQSETADVWAVKGTVDWVPKNVNSDHFLTIFHTDGDFGFWSGFGAGGHAHQYRIVGVKSTK